MEDDGYRREEHLSWEFWSVLWSPDGELFDACLDNRSPGLASHEILCRGAPRVSHAEA
jgi:hypothetical protein